jgi:hypothetical protein
MQATSTIAYPHANILRINLQVSPRRDLAHSAVQPHGLLGQMFGPGVPLFGRRDTYKKRRPGEVVRTRAQAEGAIEGSSAADYKLSSRFATAFRYSRFDARAAPGRNISQMVVDAARTQQQVPGAPRWEAQGGVHNLVEGLNFQGADIKVLSMGHASLAQERSPIACYEACVAHLKCLAMTFINNLSSSRQRRCWMKGGGFYLGASHSQGTTSGVVTGWQEKAGSQQRILAS